VAIVALMRRLLHALWGMLHHQQDFNPQLFHALPTKPKFIPCSAREYLTTEAQLLRRAGTGWRAGCTVAERRRRKQPT
jgi:hypothetical protein